MNFLKSKVITSLVFVLLLSIVTATNVDAQQASLNLSSNDGLSNTQFIAASGNNVYVIWMDKSLGNWEIFFKKSTDNGATFGSVINLSNSVDFTSMPAIAASGNNVYVVWHDGISGDYNEIFFTKSTDSGTTFSTPINLSNTPETSDNSQISISENNVYITWQERISRSSSNPNSDIFFVKSTDSGSTFSNPINVSNNAGLSHSFQMKTSGNNIYVVWRDTTDPVNGGIYFAKSTDNGNTFSSPKNVNSISGYSDYPYVDVSGSNVYVIWHTEVSGTPQTYFAKSIDNGNTFSTPKNLSKNPTDTRGMQIVASGNNVYVLMVDFGPPASNMYEDVYFTKSTDGGSTFSTPINLSNTPKQSSYPRMVTSGSDIYVVWSDGSYSAPNMEVLLIKSIDSGSSFGSVTNLSNTSTQSAGVQIDLSGNNLYVSWTEFLSSQNYDVFFRIVTPPPPDTIPPVVIPPQNVIVQANSTSATNVYYPQATATDNVGVTSGPTCTPSSGSVFPIGTTTVKCTASDAAGNIGSATFTVTVNPKLSSPEVLKIDSRFKNVANAWAENRISDKDFLQELQRWINSGLIVIQNMPKTSAGSSQEIPSWVRNNAGWWSSGQISDTDFASGIIYLINQGHLPISVSSDACPECWEEKPETISFEVSTNKPSYNFRDVITVKGKAHPNDTTVTVIITRPDGKIASIAQVEVSKSGTFFTEFSTNSPLFDISGKYTVRIKQGSESAETIFQLTGGTAFTCGENQELVNGKCIDRHTSYRINTSCEMLYAMSASEYPNGEKLHSLSITGVVIKYQEDFKPWLETFADDEKLRVFIDQGFSPAFLDSFADVVMKEYSINPTLKLIVFLALDPKTQTTDVNKIFEKDNCMEYYASRTGQTTATMPTSNLPYTTEVSIPAGSSILGCETTNECFVPSKVTVDVGGEVTWSNDDTAAHTVTSGDLSTDPDNVGTVFDSSLFMAGKTFSHKFDAAGEYPYFCMVHPWMRGIVIVGEGGPISYTPKPESQPEPDVDLNVFVNRSLFDLEDIVQIDVTLDGITDDEHVAIDIRDPTGSTVISRTLLVTPTMEEEMEFKIPEHFKTGTYQVTATVSISGKTFTDTATFKIESQFNQIRILSVEATNQQGNPSSFTIGEMGFVKVTLDANKNIATLITVNLFDSELTSIGIGSIKTTLSSGQTEIILSFLIPENTAKGDSEIFVNAFSDWPSQGGVPQTNEFSAKESVK